MPTVYVNDRAIEVPEGLNMIQVAKLLGIEIPHFCYHPGLGVDGNCRLCLIEVEGIPKPQVACNTFVKDGLKIRTETERVHELRKAVLEFFFLNHPLDCPICDQSGECLLQDFYMRHGQYESRLDLPKVHKRKVVDVGPRVVLDAERCVLCTRCVRFCDRVTGTGELRIINRGNRSEIGTFPGKPLDNPYSLNTVDLCPVGALTSKDFRFQCRVWFLSSAKSICAGCSRGCNIYMEQNEGTIHRLRPRENQEVNRWWMCDEGRRTYVPLNENRCEVPSIGGEEVTHEEALEAIASAIRAAREKGGDGAVRMFLSPEMSNEALYAARAFARQVLDGAPIVAGSRKPAGVEDAILRKADRTPNRRGCEALGLWTDDLAAEIGKGGGLAIVIQNDLAAHDPALARLLEKYARVLYLATNEDATSRLAGIVHPVTPHSEFDGSFTNFEGRVQLFRRSVTPRGDALTVMELLRRIAARLGVEFGWVNRNAIWAEMARAVPEFEGMSPSAIGDSGMLLASLRPRAAGTAGSAGESEPQAAERG